MDTVSTDTVSTHGAFTGGMSSTTGSSGLVGPLRILAHEGFGGSCTSFTFFCGWDLRGLLSIQIGLKYRHQLKPCLYLLVEGLTARVESV